jgi:hypothetical protein
MTQDAIITLDTLHCVREDDRNEGSEPYIWPVLIKIDDLTLNTDSLIVAKHLLVNYLCLEWEQLLQTEKEDK